MFGLRGMSSYLISFQAHLSISHAVPLHCHIYQCARPLVIHHSAGKQWMPFLKTVRGIKTKSSHIKLKTVEKTQGQEQNGLRVLIKPFGFAVLVSTSSFCGSIIWQYETLRGYFQRAKSQSTWYQHKFYGKAGSFRNQINTWWNQLNPGRQLTAQLIAINCAVFLLWRLPPMQNVMLKYFTSNPYSGAPCLSMLLSVFSHRSLIHLTCNMFVLWSFSAPVSRIWGREQFLAFFLSAGVISSFTSYMFKIVRLTRAPSLGASGAILGLIGVVCSQYPDSRLSILFVDQIIPHSFSADSAMKGLIFLDVMGILFGWRLFDHAAHLGGMLFGLWYENYGKIIIWKKCREPLMKKWHELRGKP